MPTNDFVTIANAGGANVETQAAYLADPIRPTFFADGSIPNANQHGKMFRQLSAIASAIAQAVCDITGLDMLDDGNNATQLANVKTMLQLFASKSNFATAAGTNAYTFNLTPAPPSWAAMVGVPFWVKFTNGMTSLSLSVNPNGLGPKNLLRPTPAQNTPFYGDIPAAAFLQIMYDGTSVVMLSLLAPGILGSGVARTVNVPNTNTPTTIFAAVQGKVVCYFDFGTGDTFADEILFYQGDTPVVSRAAGGAPGTRTYTMSGSLLQLALTGAPGAATPTTIVLESAGPSP